MCCFVLVSLLCFGCSFCFASLLFSDLCCSRCVVFVFLFVVLVVCFVFACALFCCFVFVFCFGVALVLFLFAFVVLTLFCSRRSVCVFFLLF